MRFRALQLDSSNRRWRQIFQEYWPAYRRWYLKDGDAARPSLAQCEYALARYMPELTPLWKELTQEARGDETAARMLSLYRPPPYIFGCSQAAWVRDEPFLIRNYDYSPALAEGIILHTKWLDTKVMGMSDCLWGLVDGVNEHGLAVSLTFGGRKESGDGFGIPLILRYVLQIATSAADAVETLRRVPSHMSYNVLVLDGAGEHALVELSPDRPVKVTAAKLSTNHQRPDDWPQYAESTRSLERAEFIAGRLADENETPKHFVERFSEDPLYNKGFEQAFGTLYTAIYRPDACEASYLWPDATLSQTCSNFQEIALAIEYRTTT